MKTSYKELGEGRRIYSPRLNPTGITWVHVFLALGIAVVLVLFGFDAHLI